jgi:hypothetical protein
MSSQRRKYTQETIDAISKRFDAAPATPTPATYSTFALVRKLVPKIRRMTQTGYSWEAIAAMMAEEGVKLSANALRKYVAQRQDKKENKNRTGKRGKGAKPSRSAASSRTLLQPGTVRPSRTELEPKEDGWDETATVPEPEEDDAPAPPARPLRPSGTLPRPSIEPANTSKATLTSVGPRSSFVVRPDTDEI